MSHSSSTTNMDPPRPKKPIKRKNQLRISQPIHHQQNINPNNTNSPNHDRLHSPQRKKPRYSPSSSHSSNNNNNNMNSNNNKIPKKQSHSNRMMHNNMKSMHSNNINGVWSSYRPTHIYSATLPIESEEEILKTCESNKNLMNFSCIDYHSLVEYCKLFKLHDFEYNYHYDLAEKPSHFEMIYNENERERQQQNVGNNVNMEYKEEKIEKLGSKKRNKNNKNNNNNLSARIGKEEMNENEDEENENENGLNKKGKHHKKRKNKKNERKDKRNKNKKENENENKNKTEHYYFNSDLMDKHYEKKQRELIPKTMDKSTRLTKSELVDIVREHFLSTPLMTELNEMDVIRHFLLFIENRRNKFKKKFGFENQKH